MSIFKGRYDQFITTFAGLCGNLYLGENGKAERPVFINRIEGTESKRVVKIY